MNITLLTQALIKFIAGVICRSREYWQGRLLMGILFVPMFFYRTYIAHQEPGLNTKSFHLYGKFPLISNLNSNQVLLYTLSTTFPLLSS